MKPKKSVSDDPQGNLFQIELTVERWTENPYWQHFCGMKYFEHEMPIHPTSMTRWRKKVGDAGMEKLLAETISVGLKTKAISATKRLLCPPIGNALSSARLAFTTTPTTGHSFGWSWTSSALVWQAPHQGSLRGQGLSGQRL